MCHKQVNRFPTSCHPRRICPPSSPSEQYGHLQIHYPPLPMEFFVLMFRRPTIKTFATEANTHHSPEAVTRDTEGRKHRRLVDRRHDVLLQGKEGTRCEKSMFVHLDSRREAFTLDCQRRTGKGVYERSLALGLGCSRLAGPDISTLRITGQVLTVASHLSCWSSR